MELSMYQRSAKQLSAMFLTLNLLRKGIPGKQWIGKHRRPRPITWQMKRNTVKQLEREAENEYWLSRPYMTMEQENGHAAERRALNWQKLKESKFANFPKHKYIDDHLSHLRITKTWSS
ncbi:large ribosomal subunit protein mL63 [Antennarius striatus]|uniref:large ribosomal subunit protein mL63 n=1 Tax=Antennarius striatus TaxID=241820 RepID=UPI0035B4EB41